MTKKYVYVAQQNSDLTEGRGHMKAIGYFLRENRAIRVALGRGVQGNGDGEVVRYELGLTDPDPKVVYGWRKGWNGKWGYGWVDNRDAPENDPEYATYQRLRKKFEEGGREVGDA